MKDFDYILWACLLFCAVTLVSVIPITQQVGYEDKEVYYVEMPYQKPVYVTINHEEPIYDTVAHKEPIYDTVAQNEPIYKTVEHSDPVYETLRNVELRDESLLGDDVYKRSNVYDTNKVYSGSDTWGNSEYTFTLYYYTTIPDGSKTHSTFYQIDDWSVTSYEAIVRYDDWSEEVISGYDEGSEEVIIGYDTWSEEVIIGYDTWTEEVIDHYETDHRSEKRYRTVTKHQAVTKTVYQWIDIVVNGKKVKIR